MTRLCLFSALFVVGLVGCTTNITPPSGPIGTEVCFDPAPFRFIDATGSELCGWSVWMEAADTSLLEVGTTDDKCFNIPATCSAGLEYTVMVAGKWGPGCAKYFPDSRLYGSFVVTE